MLDRTRYLKTGNTEWEHAQYPKGQEGGAAAVIICCSKNIKESCDILKSNAFISA